MQITLYNGPRGFVEIESEHIKGKRKLVCAKDLFKRYTIEQLHNWKSIDLYYLMGITQEESMKYTPAQFKDAFKKQAAKLHPDCLKSINIDDKGLSFIALNRAYHTFTTPTRKRQYDYIIFDETIPEDREYQPDEFFEIFSKVFARNSVLSAKPYTVTFGDTTSSDADIVAFYKFWQSFESLRSFEFLCKDEDCLNREQRRNAASQNKEMLQEKKRQDNIRIKKLVNLSIKHDPRVNKNKKKEPKENISVDADGWKSTEISELERLSKMYPANARNRMDAIFKAFSKFSPSRGKREMLIKLNRIEKASKKI